MSVGFCEALLIENLFDPKWNEPKKAEMEHMRVRKIWTLVPHHLEMKFVRSKWVLQERNNKLKARLVAVECDEHVMLPINYFSPLRNITTVKNFIICCRSEGTEITSNGCFKCAFTRFS